jgi:hypothetical protein
MFVYTDHGRYRRVITEVMMPLECSMTFDRDPDDRQTLSNNLAMIHSDWLERERRDDQKCAGEKKRSGLLQAAIHAWIIENDVLSIGAVRSDLIDRGRKNR